jgi:Tfp pilus assembly protein FimT
MIVIVLIGVIASMVLPAISDLRTRSGLRSARSLVMSSLSAARSAAIQKGKTASLTLANSTLTVTAMSGLRAEPVQIQGPVSLSRTNGAVLSPLNGSPTALVYDARGLVTPVRSSISRYELRLGRRADTVCVTGAGTIMPRGCVL